MPIKILMPALSPTMTEGNIAKWLKKEGDKISAGEVIAEIETDKATMEVEAVDEGVIAKLLIPAGSEGVPVNSLIAVLVEENEKDTDIEEFIKKNSSLEAGKTKKIEVTPLKQPLISEVKTPEILAQKISDNITNRIFASPLAKRIAAQEGVSLADITGSGPHGRIIKADILSAGRNKGKVQRHTEEYRLVPNNNVRKVIAKRLLESKLTIPHFYLSIECMMDEILKVRGQVNSSADEDKAKRLSVNDFIILACAKALKEVPTANASWSEGAIMMYNNIDISVQ